MISRSDFMGDADEQRLATLIRRLVEAANVRRSCLTCEHFVEQGEGCRKAGMARPPARVIAFGCPNFSEQIPF